MWMASQLEMLMALPTGWASNLRSAQLRVAAQYSASATRVVAYGRQV